MLSAVTAIGCSTCVAVIGNRSGNRRLEKAGARASVLSSLGAVVGYTGLGVVGVGAGPLTALLAGTGAAIGIASVHLTTTDDACSNHVVEDFTDNTQLIDSNGNCRSCGRATIQHSRRVENAGAGASFFSTLWAVLGYAGLGNAVGAGPLTALL